MSDFCFIVPYRNRKMNLAQFIPYYNALFPNIDIYVIEQADEGAFNKGKLMNAGFSEFGEGYNYTCFADVDLITTEKYIDQYFYPENPTLLATHVSQFEWKLPYDEYFGGCVLLNKMDFELVDGWSNKFKGWGGEEDEMYNRIIQCGLKVDRRDVWYWSLPHSPGTPDHPDYENNIKVLKEGRKDDDGLMNCKYQVVGGEEMKGYTLLRIKV